MRSIHAEAAALRDAIRKGIKVQGKDLYVTRINCDNPLSKPCPSCAALMRRYKIRKVYYTSEDGTVLEENLSAKN